MQKTIPEHKHLIVRAEIHKPPTEPDWVKEWLTSLVDKIGMKICSGPHTAYVDIPGNSGVTGVVVIETSHIAIHVWDEPNPALMQIDVYSCAEFDPYKIAEKIKQDFDVVKIDYKYLNRETGLKPIRLKK